jgi:2-polyprenyl-6-methoxyphenol hydroxylase-like FAD-dependent oxidoreductase
MNKTEQQVVIVGAGPVGLALGAELRRLGISEFIIVDKQVTGENTSRACVVHARTLEVLEPLGVVPELIRNGVIVPTFRIRDRSRILATISFEDLKTDFPFTLMCPQDRVEAILLRCLQSRGGVVQRPCKVFDIRPEEDEVQVRWKSDQEARTIHAKWVVGCDGAHSVVREQASIPFEGGAYDESFVLADVEMEWPLDRDEVNLFYSGKGLMVVAPLPDDHFRIVATVDQAPFEPSITDVESILRERGPENPAVSIRRLVWSSRFYIQHRVAKAVRQGRMLLAGDAAHVHSPAGGQGMNTGIQDAVSLANALHQTIQGGDDKILDHWNDERLKIAHSVVEMTDRLTKVATISSPALQMLRNTAVEWMGHIPFIQHAFAEKLAELSNR